MEKEILHKECVASLRQFLKRKGPMETWLIDGTINARVIRDAKLKIVRNKDDFDTYATD